MRKIRVKYPNACGRCGRGIIVGEEAWWDENAKKIYHPWCANILPPDIIYVPRKDVFHVTHISDEVREALRNIPNVRFEKGGVLITPQPGSAESIWRFVSEFKATLSAEGIQRLVSLTVQAVGNLEATQKVVKGKDTLEGISGQPYRFQINNAELALKHKRLLIGDEAGLGKTISAIIITSRAEEYPVVIFCPSIVKINWQRELLSWVEGLDPDDIEILRGQKSYDLAEKLFYIVNYDIARHWASQLVNVAPKTIILDEFHYLSNWKSQRTQAVAKVSEGAEYVIGLSGTPISGRPGELVPVLKILGRIKEVGGERYFARRYSKAHFTKYGMDTSGADNLEELNNRLRSQGIYTRLRQDQVLDELPEKQRQVIPIELSNWSEYSRAEINFNSWAKQYNKQLKDSLRLDTGEISIHDFKEGGAIGLEAISKLNALKALATAGKYDQVKKWISDFLGTGEKLILFAYLRPTQRLLASTFAGDSTVTAIYSDSPKKRQAAIDRFQNDPEARLIICSLEAVGIGITLTSAHHVAFVELPWVPTTLDQAENRAKRIGQENKMVNCYYFVAANTIEERIARLIDEKLKIVTRVVDGVDVWELPVINPLLGEIAA